MYGQRARRACERNAAVILVRPTDSYPSLYLAADDNRDQLARGRSEPSSGARHCAPLVRKHRCCCSDIDCTSSSLQLDHPLAISTRMTNNLRVARTPVRGAGRSVSAGCLERLSQGLFDNRKMWSFHTRICHQLG